MKDQMYFWLRRGKTLIRPLWDETSRQVGIMMFGTLLRQILGIVSSAILARGLGPENLSVFSVVGSVIAIAGTFSDFGFSNSAIRLIAGDMASDENKARETSLIFFYLKLFSALFVFGILWVLGRFSANLVGLPTESGSFLVRIAGLGLVATAISGILSTVLRARQQFWELVGVQVVHVMVTITLFGLLFFTGRLTVVTALLVGAASALIGSLFGLVRLPRRWLPSLTELHLLTRSKVGRMFFFSKWLWVSAILSIIFSQLDLLLLNRFLSQELVGYYALAVNLSLKIAIIQQSLHMVLLPTVSTLSTTTEYLDYLRRNLLRSGFIIVGILFFLPFAPFFIQKIYGMEYAASAGIFLALIGLLLFDLMATPFVLLAFPMDIPGWIVASDSAGVIFLLLFGIYAIPLWGIYGVIIAKLLSKIIATALLGVPIVMRIRTVYSAGSSDFTAR